MLSLPLPHRRLRRSLENLASRVEEPSSKLWFIQRTLESFHRNPAILQETPLLRNLALYYNALETLAQLSRRADSPPFRPSSVLILYRIRYLIITFGTALMLSLVYLGGHLSYYGFLKANDYLSELFGPLFAPPASALASPPPRSLDYPDSRLGPAPREIWLVETKGEEELWSNGLRVVTSYTSQSRKRSYVLFPRHDTLELRQGEEPVGIVYHTSENDFAPFQSGFNREILRTTRGLLGWLHRRNLYNYFVDRFGQVYRLVIDSHTASHAGMSIWTDEDYYYLNLSDSFLGVCFESQWISGTPGEEILTAAQLQAGLNLTDMLRARYRIADSNCVPHGLVSVNPRKMLIGYHVDWARGFPFAALGLTDKYSVPVPSMLEFGFGYDGNLVEALKGDLWPGIRSAQVELARRAEEQGVQPDSLQRELRSRYKQLLELAQASHAVSP